LVSRLQRYPRHSENTLTEALASALEAAPEIGRALLERYGGREVAGEIAVKTQIPAGRGFCDLELRSPPSGPVAVLTWFEIKKDAPESGDDQLERYAAALAAEHPGVGTLVYLTRHGEPSNLEGVVDLSWIKLGELLREECQRLPAESYGRRLTEEFLRYLVEQGLTVIEPLSRNRANPSPTTTRRWTSSTTSFRQLLSASRREAGRGRGRSGTSNRSFGAGLGGQHPLGASILPPPMDTRTSETSTACSIGTRSTQIDS